jgi:hypothetical protein
MGTLEAMHKFKTGMEDRVFLQACLSETICGFLLNLLMRVITLQTKSNTILQSPQSHCIY